MQGSKNLRASLAKIARSLNASSRSRACNRNDPPVHWRSAIGHDSRCGLRRCRNVYCCSSRLPMSQSLHSSSRAVLARSAAAA
jgi:hypothetical protein